MPAMPAMRLYEPTDAVLSGAWAPPRARRAAWSPLPTTANCGFLSHAKPIKDRTVVVVPRTAEW